MQGGVARGSKLGSEAGSGVRAPLSLPVRSGPEPHPARRAVRWRRGRPGLSGSRGPGPGNREGPRRGRARAAGDRAGLRKARATTPGAHPGFALVAAATAASGELRAWAPGGPGRAAHRTHRGRSAGAKTMASGAPSAATASFPGPLLKQQRRLQRRHGSYPGSGIGGGGGGSSTSAPVTTSAPARAPPGPLRRLLIGRAGHGVAPAALEGRWRREEEAERRAGRPRAREGVGPEREGGGRRGAEIRAGERKEEVGGEGAVCGGGSRTGPCRNLENWARFGAGRARGRLYLG